MAELGPIEYRDVNYGTRVVDRRGEVQAVAQGLDAAKTVMDEGIKASVTGDMMDAIEQADVDESLSVEEKYPAGTREQYLYDRVSRLQQKIQQGNSNQARMAEMQVKNILAEAQSKFPWLYEDLQRRAGAVMSGSAKMQMLGTEDDMLAQQARTAQAQLDDLQKYATAAPTRDGGGLGMPPELIPGTPEWIGEYERLSVYRGQRAEARTYELAAVANGLLNLENGGRETVRRTISGQSSLVRARVDAEAEIYGYNDILLELGKGTSADLAKVERWMNGPDRIEFVKAIRAGNIEMKNSVIDAFPNIWLTDEGKLLRADLDDVYNSIEDMANKIEQATDIDTLKYANAQFNAIQMMTYDRAPESAQRMYEFMKDPMFGNFLKAHELGMFSANQDIMNQISSKMPLMTMQMYPGVFGSQATDDNMALLLQGSSTGSLILPPNANAGDINRAIATAIHNAPQTKFMVPIKGEVQKVEAAMLTAGLAQRYLSYQLSQIDDPRVGAIAATEGLTRLNHAAHVLAETPQVYSDVSRLLLEAFASEDLISAVVAAQRPHAQAWALKAEELYTRTDPTASREAIKQEYRGTPVQGVPLREILSLDLKLLDEKGEIDFLIDPEALDRAASNYLQGNLRDYRPGATISERDRRVVTNEVKEYALRWKNEIEYQLNLERNIALAKDPNPQKPKREDTMLSYYYDTWRDVFHDVQAGGGYQ